MTQTLKNALSNTNARNTKDVAELTWHTCAGRCRDRGCRSEVLPSSPAAWWARATLRTRGSSPDRAWKKDTQPCYWIDNISTQPVHTCTHNMEMLLYRHLHTTIREDGAAYTVSTSSLTMEVEAVTHALRWIASRGDSQTTHAVILTDSVSLLQKVESEMCRWSTSTFENSCGCTALDMPEWSETTEQTDWRAKQPSRVACISEDLKCWEPWNTTCGHHTIDRLEERGVERGFLDEHWNRFKSNVAETSERRDGAHMGFFERINTILNWTELKFGWVEWGVGGGGGCCEGFNMCWDTRDGGWLLAKRGPRTSGGVFRLYPNADQTGSNTHKKDQTNKQQQTTTTRNQTPTYYDKTQHANFGNKPLFSSHRTTVTRWKLRCRTPIFYRFSCVHS